MIIQPTLTPKQAELYSAFLDPTILEILFGWWWRGGKTRGISEIVNITCLAYPWVKRLVGRKERDDLRKTTLTTILKVLGSHKMRRYSHYDINMTTKELTYPNGSQILFTELKPQPSDPDYNWLWSYEITWFRVDEVQQLPRKVIDILKSRCTEKIAEYGLTPKGIMSCNPDKGWLYQEFIKPHREGKLQPDRIFIQSLYIDNPHIDHEKYRMMLKDADKATRERLLHGNWDYDDNPYKTYKYDDILCLFTNPRQIDGDKYIIVDVAGEGVDRAIVSVWVWVTMVDYVILNKCTAPQLSEEMHRMAQKRVVKRTNRLYDWDGLGWWLSGLWCPVFHWWAAPIAESTAISTSEVEGYRRAYNNLRTQCYIALNRSFASGEMLLMVDDPAEREKIIQELDVIQYRDVGKDWPVKIIPKEKIKEIIGRSPDRADTIMMRMYFELQRNLWPMVY